MAISLPKDVLMRWGTTRVTDHNRSPLAIGYEQIRTDNRTVSGVARRQHVAYKHTFSTSWADVPKSTAHTVDGYAGGSAMLALYLTTTGTFTLTLTDYNAVTTTYTVMFESFDYSINKRLGMEFWNINVTLKEV